jgi:hypothetical protein
VSDVACARAGEAAAIASHSNASHPQRNGVIAKAPHTS